MNLRAFTQRMLLPLSLVLGVASVFAAPLSYRLHVDGLACPFCAYGIEKKLGAVSGVQHIETNIRDGTVIVTMQDGVSLDEALARQAVQDAGFSLRKLEPLPPAASGPSPGQAK